MGDFEDRFNAETERALEYMRGVVANSLEREEIPFEDQIWEMEVVSFDVPQMICIRCRIINTVMRDRRGPSRGFWRTKKIGKEAFRGRMKRAANSLKGWTLERSESSLWTHMHEKYQWDTIDIFLTREAGI